MQRFVLVFSLVLLSACGGAATETTPTTSPPGSTTEPAPTTTTTAAPTTTTTEATTTTVPGFGSGAFAVPFTFDGPAVGLELDSRAGDQAVFFTAGNNRWVSFVTTGPSTIEEWAKRLSIRGEVGEPFETSAGGIVADGIDATFTGLTTLYSPDGIQAAEYVAEGGDRCRLYVLHVRGDSVKVFVLASEAEFDGWLAEVEPILEALVWG